jgi:hypothetical protein
MRQAGRTAAAFLVGTLSFVAAAYSGVVQQRRLLLLADLVPAQLAPIPRESLPAGAVIPSPSPPLTAEQTRTIVLNLWRSPLDEQSFNLLYTDGLRTHATAPVVTHRAALLAKLGWRFTPLDQNLIIRGATNGNYQEVVDRADALLRRQKIDELAISIMQAMEARPEVHRYVVEKLKGNPPWRPEYLASTTPQSGPVLLARRAQTLDVLIGTRSLAKGEITPSLAAMAGVGMARAAHDLWIRWSGQRSANLVYDSRFRAAAAADQTVALASPFEWKLGRDTNYSTSAADNGIEIDWDRRGVPTFLSQLVPVAPGNAYVLTIAGHADGAPLSTILAPAIVCGADPVAPTKVEGTKENARFFFPVLPAGCDMGQLSINGALDSGTGSITVTITDVVLRRSQGG